MPKLRAEEQQSICEIRKSNLTYLPDSRLASVIEVIRDLERLRFPGVFVEAGYALGGSTILISRIKSRERALYVYDVFEMIPPPAFQDSEDVHERYKPGFPL